MPAEVSIFAPIDHYLAEVQEKNVSRCWHAGEDDDLSRLTAEIERLNINILMIQFNYGFFNLEKFAQFLIKQVSDDRVVVITLHSTTDPTHEPNKKLENIAQALRACRRILVHSIDDLNRLKLLGITENVACFPHGVPEYDLALDEPRKISKQDSFTIASYGFFLPHKGLIELIKAVLLLKESGKNVRLKMVNAEYPAPESEKLIQKVKRLIRDNNLDESVELHTDYLEDVESFKILASADLLVFPYQVTGESSSAAVRYGIATGQPVAVTPLAIFEDVSTVVHKLPGTTPTEIADGISEIISELYLKTNAVSTLASAGVQWRKEHNYARIGQRMGNLLKSLWLNRSF